MNFSFWLELPLVFVKLISEDDIQQEYLKEALLYVKMEKVKKF